MMHCLFAVAWLYLTELQTTENCHWGACTESDDSSCPTTEWCPWNSALAHPIRLARTSRLWFGWAMLAICTCACLIKLAAEGLHNHTYRHVAVYRSSEDINVGAESWFSNLQSLIRFQDYESPLSVPHCWAYPDVSMYCFLVAYNQLWHHRRKI